MSEKIAIFNKKSFQFSFHYIQPYQQRGAYVLCTFFKLSLFLALSLDNEHESMLKGNQNLFFLFLNGIVFVNRFTQTGINPN